MKILDSHFHVWNPQTLDYPWLVHYPLLQREFRVEEIEELARPLGVEGAIVVQAHNSLEGTKELLARGGASSFVEGVVGWVDLTSPNVADQIQILREETFGHKLVGIRHEVQAESDPSWLTWPTVSQGLSIVADLNLTYDFLVLPHQLPATIEAARRLPRARFVVDHGAKPPIASGDNSSWRTHMESIANLENVGCKLSGLVTEVGPGWTRKQIEPYIHDLLTWFGTERLMFGSDWPVATQVASYAEVLQLAIDVVEELSANEQHSIFYSNAKAFYQIDVPG